MLELLNQLDGFQPNTQVKVGIWQSAAEGQGILVGAVKQCPGKKLGGSWGMREAYPPGASGS